MNINTKKYQDEALTKVSDNEISEVTSEAEGQLAVDVYKTDNDFIIEAPIAGIKINDVDISVNGDSITIRGSRHRDNEVNEENYLYQECFWGKFSRTVILDQEIDVDNVSAKLKDGVLRITLPKINRTRSKKISVSDD